MKSGAHIEIHSNFIVIAIPDIHRCVAFLSSAAPRSKTEIFRISQTTQYLRGAYSETTIRVVPKATRGANRGGRDHGLQLGAQRNLPQIHVSPQVIKFLGYDPAPIPQSDSERLVTAGKAKGLTQKEMAKRIGVNPTTLARWERGKCQRSEKFRRIVSFWFPGGPDLPRMPAIKLQHSG
jgi:Helix-turn-helix